jgi:hypothetical protein
METYFKCQYNYLCTVYILFNMSGICLNDTLKFYHGNSI